MKLTNKISLYFGLGVFCVAVNSCSLEEPFKSGGEGTLRLNTEINGEVKKTRAIEGEYLTELRNKCVVYIEKKNYGIVRKYKGLDNVPESISLQTGDYIIETWTGDSVSASFDSKFYRGYDPIEITEEVNSYTAHCKLANVLVSVDSSSLDVNLSDMKVTFSHSRGALVFDETLIREETKGYFMMPNADTDLTYLVEGTAADGSAYSKQGTIENVERAHEYALTISEEESEITDGGALIRIEIADIPVIEENVEIYMGPAVAGVGYDIDSQVVSTDKNFTDTKVYIRGYNGLSSVIMSLSDNFNGLLESGLNLTDGTTVTQLRNYGVNVELTESTDATYDGGSVKVDDMYVTFTKAFLDALPDSETEYVVTFEAVDGNHKEGSGTLRIANNLDAVEHIDPVVLADASVLVNDPLAVLAKRATLTAYIQDVEAATNYGIMYRELGTSEWLKAYPASTARLKNTRATIIPYTVTVTDLKPGTVYEFKAFCDDFEGSETQTFTTESIYTIPNASMEEWSEYSEDSAVIIPGSGGVRTFWDTGNHGSATMSVTLTNSSDELVHSGNYSAKLVSQFVSVFGIGKFAAGNLFAGTYDNTVGTNGELTFGREYNGSHPTSLQVYANYRPGVGVSGKGANDSYIAAGQLDEGQIYVAISSAPISVKTASADTLFDPEADEILGYGQVTWNQDFAADGQLELVNIPITYYDRAKTNEAKYLIIVCSASKYGDFFSGGVGSTMYLDDFELVYE